MTTTKTLDSVQLAVLESRFDAIARSMLNTLLRSARTGVLESTSAPAASVGPSTPSVPTLASTAAVPSRLISDAAARASS